MHNSLPHKNQMNTIARKQLHGNKRIPIIFSGHNDRAVIALCRYFKSVNRDFYIVAKYLDDFIFKTEWKRYILIQRCSNELTINLTAKIAAMVIQRGFTPSICPTSEFLNQFFISNSSTLISQGWHLIYPHSKIYALLTNKASSATYIQETVKVMPPPEQKAASWRAPCVLKPIYNICDHQVLYPILCNNSKELNEALMHIKLEQWFSQDLILGQSFYFCAYLDQNGFWDGYWQENLIQQPKGKSMLLARSCANPGVNIELLMRELSLLGYRGPFMMEIIRDDRNSIFFIEINPRFWGPLELSRQSCPRLLERYLADIDDIAITSEARFSNKVHYYSWAYGANDNSLKIYPQAEGMRVETRQYLLKKYDVYAQADTYLLSGKH